MRSFANKNILIIGGSSGIGEAVADEVLRGGGSLWVWNRREREDLIARGAVTASVDVTQDFDASSLPLPEELHGVVYAPGSIQLAPFRMLKADTFQQEFAINVLGAVRVLKVVEERLFAANGAAVVLFSTVAVHRGMPFHASIAAAKGAVEGLAVSLAAEWAPKQVRVNVVAPSLTDTPLASRLLNSEKKAAAAAERHPLRRVGTAADSAAAASYLLSAESSWVTGQIIGVDGGMGTLAGV